MGKRSIEQLEGYIEVLEECAGTTANQRDKAMAERAALQARIDAALARLNAPLPPCGEMGAKYWRETVHNLEHLMNNAVDILEGNDGS